jgi:integrase
MGGKANFTAERVSSFQCQPGKQQSIFWDGKTPGLGLRVTASGARSYIFETRLNGKTLRITIGDLRTWSVGKAQAKATSLKTLTDQGIDPRLQAAEQRAKVEAAQKSARQNALTLGEIWPIYIEQRKAKWSERHHQDHLTLSARGGEHYKRGEGITVAGPLAPLMTLLMIDLTGERIALWLETEAAKRPTKAAQSYRLLRAFLRWASERPEYRGIIHADAYRTRAVRDALPKSNVKDDCLQREQLPTWFEQILRIHNPVISAYLQALLITGARREEMAGLRWEDVDFRWRSLTIRDKTNGKRTIPLPPYLASLILKLKRLNETPPNIRQLRRREVQDKPGWAPSPWVFSSPTSGDGNLAEPRIAHNSALANSNLPHLTLHGLRRSFGTLCEWVEVPVGIVAQIQGHAPSAIAEKHYRRRPLDLLRMWHDKIEAWMLEQAGIDFKQESRGLRAANA